jgi:glycosyltransferase involved in cell wall biosynthesis
MDPLVSIVIPTYNRAGLICQTIDNIFQQTYSRFELIIVDDGSTDDTLARLRSYGKKIRVIEQKNSGPAVARNRGAAAAEGEIIAFQDSDDLWKPTKIARQVALLERFGRTIPCCLCNVLMRVVNGKQFTSFDHSVVRMRENEGIWLNVPEVLAATFILFNQAAAIRRDAFERVGGFDANLKYLEDYDLPLRLALEGPWAFIQEPLVLYREDSPESFHEKAMKEPFVLKECELEICRRLLAKTVGKVEYAGFQKNLSRRVRRARRQVHAMKLFEEKSPVSHAVAKLLEFVDHYMYSAFIRSPWYPRPNTLPVDGWPVDQNKPQAVESVVR